MRSKEGQNTAQIVKRNLCHQAYLESSVGLSMDLVVENIACDFSLAGYL